MKKSTSTFTPRKRKSSDESSEAELERSDSFAQAHKKKRRRRTQKSPQERWLRKTIGNKIKSRFDKAVVDGKFHDKNKQIIIDLVDEKASDVIHEVIGSDYSDEALPDKAFAMAVSVIDRRWRYEKDKPPPKPTKRKPTKRKIKVENEPNESDEPDEPNESDEQPNEPNESDEPNPTDDDEKHEDCYECIDDPSHVMYSIEECFPESERESGMLFRCKACWEKSSVVILAAQKNAQERRAKVKKSLVAAKAKAAKRNADAKTAAAKKKEAAAAKKKAKADAAAAKKKAKADADAKKKQFPLKGEALRKYFAAAAIKNKITPYRMYHHEHAIYANVLGLWPGDGNWYQAQVYDHHGPHKYALYFPEDNEVYIGAPTEHIKLPPGNKLWAKYTRDKYKGHEFEHAKVEHDTPSKLGRYKVLKLGWAEGEKNKYICKHIDSGEEVRINMGYVQRQLLKTLTGEWAKF